MRLSSVIIAFGAIASAVYAVQVDPQLKERGTYEVDTVLNAGYYNSAKPSQAYSPPSGAYQGPASPGATHWVTVGGAAGLLYTPPFVIAAVGDVVVFTFGTKNHTLTQSTFAQPCVKMDGGADSGFQPTDGTNSPMFQMTVTTESPLWFYCMQTGHCVKGMVFAINPPPTGDKTYQNYLAKAMGSGTSTVVATATTSYTVSYSAPAAPPPPAATGSGTDEQCQCVCNIDVSNGAPNSLQGIGVFGGSIGNVQLPWGIAAAPASAPPAAPPSDPPPPPASSAPPADPPTTTASGYQTPAVVNIPNVGQGDSSQPEAAPASNADSSNSGNGFTADGLLGGANGK